MISVVVTNFNYAHYLGRCLRSLVDQTINEDEYEIIFVDDCSTDDSLHVASPFQERINIITCEENVGLASASNLGIRAAKGRFIVRVDSDDFVHPEFLRFISVFMELKSSECDAVAVDYLEVDPSGNLINQKSSQEIPIACGVAYKAEVMLELGLYKEGLRIGEDGEFFSKFTNAGYILKNLNLPLYRYTKHTESLTSNTRLI